MCRYRSLPRTLHNSDNAPHTTLPRPKRASSFGYPIKLKWAGKARPFQGFAPQNAWRRHAASGLTPGGSFPMCQYKPLPRTLHNSDNAPHTTLPRPKRASSFGYPIKLKWAGKARPFQGFAPQNAWRRHAASGLTPGGSFPMCQYKPLPRTLHNSDNAPHTTPATRRKR